MEKREAVRTQGRNLANYLHVEPDVPEGWESPVYEVHTIVETHYFPYNPEKPIAVVINPRYVQQWETELSWVVKFVTRTTTRTHDVVWRLRDSVPPGQIYLSLADLTHLGLSDGQKIGLMKA
jgi:hypothetical protein